MKALSFKGILIGGIVDVGLSFVLGIPLSVYVILKVASLHLPKAQIHDAISGINREMPIFLGQMVLGIVCSILGGYLAARIAKHDEMLNGAMSSWFCLLVAFYALSHVGPVFSPLVSALTTLAGPAGATLGGYIRLRQIRSGQMAE